MNLYKEFNQNERQLLQNIGITVENKDYGQAEIKHCQNEIAEFIMSQSSKNGDIARAHNLYDSILDKIVK